MYIAYKRLFVLAHKAVLFVLAGLLEAVMKNGFSTASSTEENHTRKRTRSEGKSTPMEDDYTKEQVEAVER